VPTTPNTHHLTHGWCAAAMGPPAGRTTRSCGGQSGHRLLDLWRTQASVVCGYAAAASEPVNETDLARALVALPTYSTQGLRRPKQARCGLSPGQIRERHCPALRRCHLSFSMTWALLLQPHPRRYSKLYSMHCDQVSALSTGGAAASSSKQEGGGGEEVDNARGESERRAPNRAVPNPLAKHPTVTLPADTAIEGGGSEQPEEPSSGGGSNMSVYGYNVTPSSGGGSAPAARGGFTGASFQVFNPKLPIAYQVKFWLVIWCKCDTGVLQGGVPTPRGTLSAAQMGGMFAEMGGMQGMMQGGMQGGLQGPSLCVIHLSYAVFLPFMVATMGPTDQYDEQ